MLVVFMLITVMAYILFTQPDGGFYKGFGEVMIERYGLENPFAEPAYSLGKVIGAIMLPLLIIVLELLFAVTRKRIAFFLLIAVDFIFSAATLNLPLMPIIFLILALVKSSQNYFSSKIEKIEAPDLLDHDLK